MADREQPADVEVLACLRLDGLIGGNHQQHQIDAPHAREHVPHEALVARDIDKTKTQHLAVRPGQFQMCEADVDGDPAALLLFETIGIDASESLHQRSLAVIDVSRSADNNGFHGRTSIGVRRGRRPRLPGGAKLRSLAAMQQPQKCITSSPI